MLRICDTCGIEDEQAHHVHYIVITDGNGVARDVSISKHIQCCATDGCEVCTIDVDYGREQGIDNTPSDAFTKLMADKPDELRQRLFEHLGMVTLGFGTVPVEEDDGESGDS